MAKKSRIDLLKWKFIVIAALGSIALGVGIRNENSQFPQEATFCLIPLVCVYVDLLCRHLNLRILVISKFIRTVSDLDLTSGNQLISDNKSLLLAYKYEKFCADLRSEQQQKKSNNEPF